MGTEARPPGSGAPRQKTHAPVFNCGPYGAVDLTVERRRVALVRDNKVVKHSITAYIVALKEDYCNNLLKRLQFLPLISIIKQYDILIRKGFP